MYVELRKIELRLIALLLQFNDKMPSDQIQDMRELCDAGEPGVAFENFCVQLIEFDLTIAVEQFHELQELGTLMKLDPKYWERLSVDPPKLN